MSIDLLKVAQIEKDDGDALFGHLDGLFDQADLEIDGHPDAVIWQGGNFTTGLNPVCHTLTDRYALVGTLMAADVLGLPWYGLPFMAQYRHDQELAPLKWFAQMPFTSIKWSTAGDTYVNDGSGGKVIVMGKSGNAPLRTDAGVYCNVRPYGNVTVVRCMPNLPYSQNRKAFDVSAETGVIHSEMNTPGIQMAYACRHFLRMVHETGAHGRVAFKPTQAMEDGINAGILSWLLQGTKFEIGRKFAVDGYVEHREYVDRIIALLPKDFKAGMEEWGGLIDHHISDTNYGILVRDIIEKREQVIVLATDLDGDRLTDLLADISDPLRAFADIVATHLGRSGQSGMALWNAMGYTTGNGRDMGSTMFRMEGDPIIEQTLGSADTMLDRLLNGDEYLGEDGQRNKQPYDPRIHFTLIRDAYLQANPGNDELSAWLDAAIASFDGIYGGERPPFLEGYEQLQRTIKPWGTAG